MMIYFPEAGSKTTLSTPLLFTLYKFLGCDSFTKFLDMFSPMFTSMFEIFSVMVSSVCVMFAGDFSICDFLI